MSNPASVVESVTIRFYFGLGSRKKNAKSVKKGIKEIRKTCGLSPGKEGLGDGEFYQCSHFHKNPYFKLILILVDAEDDAEDSSCALFIQKEDVYFFGFEADRKIFELKDRDPTNPRKFKEEFAELIASISYSVEGLKSFLPHALIRGIQNLHRGLVKGNKELGGILESFIVGLCESARLGPVEDLVVDSFEFDRIGCITCWMVEVLKMWQHLSTALIEAFEGNFVNFNAMNDRYKEANAGRSLLENVSHGREVFKLFAAGKKANIVNISSSKRVKWVPRKVMDV